MTRDKKAKILLIDDDPGARELIHDLLAEEGHTVAVYADGQSGISGLHDEPFDLVITDLVMPGLTGWQVAKLAKLQNPATPVVMVTGFGHGIDPEEARRKGVDFLVLKPLNLENFTAIVAQALAWGGNLGKE